METFVVSNPHRTSLVEVEDEGKDKVNEGRIRKSKSGDAVTMSRKGKVNNV